MGFNEKHMDGTNYWHADTPQEGLDPGCGGTGVLHCYCGGDFCVCGNFGVPDLCRDDEVEDELGDRWDGLE